MKQLTSLNFALSNRCNAKCIWCPTTRGIKSNFDMDTELVYKIVDEVSSKEFPYKLKTIHISENGEALYHKDFVDIVRYIKRKLPDARLDMLSNFGLMSKKVAKVLTEEKIFDTIQVNIDGHDEHSYRAVKGIPFKSVMKNLKYFLEYRRDYNPELDFKINVMPAFEYTATVYYALGENPEQVKPGQAVPFSTYDMVCQSLLDHLGSELYDSLTTIKHSKPGLWAERDKFKKLGFDPEQNLKCPMVDVLEQSIYVAPNGDYYACCLDDNNDLVLGNLKDNTVLELWHSQDRIQFVDDLKAQSFEKIGYPCNTVCACQTIMIPDDKLKELESLHSDAASVVFE